MFNEVRWAQYRERIHLASVHQLAQNETSFDRFADADIIRNQQAWRRHAKRHQQGDKLIGPRLKGELGSRPERACATAKRQAHRVRQQCRLSLNGRGRISGKIETGRLDRQKFESRVEDNCIAAAP
ncbi:MAG: hypothetical protein AMXMBFR74_25200 [Parvibaculum sp.]